MNIFLIHVYFCYENCGHRLERQSGTQLRKWNLWGYVDARDVAQACCLGLEKPVNGSVNLIVAANDTVMNLPSSELMREVFPGVRVKANLGEFETLPSIDRARAVLGYEPKYLWRNH